MMQEPGKIWPGTSLRRTVNFFDEADDPVDPDTVTFKLCSPCNQITSYVYDTDDEVQRSGVGAYYADFIPDIAGRWHWRWETTGTGTTIAKEGNFIVQYSKFVDDVDTGYAFP